MDFRPDWQTGKSVVECNRYMLENHIETDIEFVLQTGSGRNVSLPAHKYVLMSRNPVFFAMFSGPMAESGKAVNISDVSPSAFRQMLRWVFFFFLITDAINALKYLKILMQLSTLKNS